MPLPEATQWELLAPLGQLARPVFAELVAQAANAPLLHHDDTTMRILDLRRPGSATADQLALMVPPRKGMFTTNVLAEGAQYPGGIVFYRLAARRRKSGRSVAPTRRRPGPTDPDVRCAVAQPAAGVQYDPRLLSGPRAEGICDGGPQFSRRMSACARIPGRGLSFDAAAKELDFPPEARLIHHQTHSQPVLARLKAWMQEKFDAKHVEPNSGLGQAIGYMLKHWEPLTLFLRQPGAPLDNNRCEQALKMAILHRKNSLSYKTFNSARTGDLFMSLIHTCRLNRINPFKYLLAIATHAEAVTSHPADWLPWNYPKLDTSPKPKHDPPGGPA